MFTGSIECSLGEFITFTSDVTPFVCDADAGIVLEACVYKVPYPRSTADPILGWSQYNAIDFTPGVAKGIKALSTSKGRGSWSYSPPLSGRSNSMGYSMPNTLIRSLLTDSSYLNMRLLSLPATALHEEMAWRAQNRCARRHCHAPPFRLCLRRSHDDSLMFRRDLA